MVSFSIFFFRFFKYRNFNDPSNQLLEAKSLSVGDTIVPFCTCKRHFSKGQFSSVNMIFFSHYLVIVICELRQLPCKCLFCSQLISFHAMLTEQQNAQTRTKTLSFRFIFIYTKIISDFYRNCLKQERSCMRVYFLYDIFYLSQNILK